VKGGIGYQVTQVFLKSGIFTPGQSKHTAKEAARVAGASTWHELGKELKIYSYATAETYKDVWHQFANYAKAELGLRDIEKTASEHIRAYLESRIDQGIAYSTYQKEAAALQKFETTLNAYSAYSANKPDRYAFSEAIKEVSQEARQELVRHDVSRAYENPAMLVSAIDDDNHRLAASIQYEGGARISEAALIKDGQLRGLEKDKITGELNGTIHLDFTKGGKERDIQVSRETYEKLEQHVKENGRFQVDKNAYRNDLKATSEMTNQHYQGSHGLRWSYAQERHNEVQQHGYTYEQSLTIVSQELGHERADITEHYLR